jgi:hypothetical protein
MFSKMLRSLFIMTALVFLAATTAIAQKDIRTRAIFFENGKAIGADISQADPGDFGASRESDVTVVRIGNERYDIPDAVIFGG